LPSALVVAVYMGRVGLCVWRGCVGCLIVIVLLWRCGLLVLRSLRWRMCWRWMVRMLPVVLLSGVLLRSGWMTVTGTGCGWRLSSG